MNAYVAQRAALIAGVEHVMDAFQVGNAIVAGTEVVGAIVAAQAQGKDHRTLE